MIRWWQGHGARTSHTLMGLVLVVCLVGQLAGCGAKSWRKGGVVGSKPYTVRGKTYYPLKSAHGFIEEGVASWYGPGFHGKKTANGERYDQYALTAAHKILPLGTEVKVTHLGSRKSIVVRINDRGPFVEDRVIDLSRKGAEQLGMIGSGTARVRVQSLGTVSGIKDDGDMLGAFYVQVGSFISLENAQRLAKTIQNTGFATRYTRDSVHELWHVQVGPWPDLFAAEKILDRLKRQHTGAFVVRE